MCKCKTLKNSPFYKCYPTLHQMEPIETPKKETPPLFPRGGKERKSPSLIPPIGGRKKSVVSGFERKWPLMRR